MKGIKRKIRDNRYMSWVLIISNWVFQSIPNADKTEKIFKILFTLTFWAGIFLLFYHYSKMSIIETIVVSFVIAHTFNWIINGNFYNLIIHRLMLVKLSKTKLFDYIYILEKKVESQDWILYTASFGSICKGTLKDSSDLDISIVRKPGLKNALKSIIFALKEKKFADFKGIPLEIYISDSPKDSIKRFGGEKNPVIIFDPEDTIDKYYQEKLTISEARRLNKI
jgi:predicted nucleotidyltransferase